LVGAKVEFCTLIAAMFLTILALPSAQAQGVLTLTCSGTSEVREGGKVTSRSVSGLSLIINFNAKAVKGFWADTVASITRIGRRFIWFGGNLTPHTQIAGTLDRVTGKAELFETQTMPNVHINTAMRWDLVCKRREGVAGRWQPFGQRRLAPSWEICGPISGESRPTCGSPQNSGSRLGITVPPTPLLRCEEVIG
jgi:hypothetical protein